MLRAMLRAFLDWAHEGKPVADWQSKTVNIADRFMPGNPVDFNGDGQLENLLANPHADVNGWFNSPLVVAFTGSEALSYPEMAEMIGAAEGSVGRQVVTEMFGRDAGAAGARAVIWNDAESGSFVALPLIVGGETDGRWLGGSDRGPRAQPRAAA